MLSIVIDIVKKDDNIKIFLNPCSQDDYNKEKDLQVAYNSIFSLINETLQHNQNEKSKYTKSRQNKRNN